MKNGGASQVSLIALSEAPAKSMLWNVIRKEDAIYLGAGRMDGKGFAIRMPGGGEP
jgi:hypothetical protein